jgi:hypothetical protein
VLSNFAFLKIDINICYVEGKASYSLQTRFHKLYFSSSVSSASQIEEIADMYAFVMQALGLKYYGDSD